MLLLNEIGVFTLNVKEELKKKIAFYLYNSGAGIAQSVWQLATGWTIEGSEFEFR
jgi:hypothetical protein